MIGTKKPVVVLINAIFIVFNLIITITILGLYIAQTYSMKKYGGIYPEVYTKSEFVWEKAVIINWYLVIGFIISLFLKNPKKMKIAISISFIIPFIVAFLFLGYFQPG